MYYIVDYLFIYYLLLIIIFVDRCTAEIKCDLVCG